MAPLLTGKLISAIRVESFGIIPEAFLKEGFLAIPQGDGTVLLVKQGGYILDLGPSPGTGAHKQYAVVNLAEPDKSGFIEEYKTSNIQSLRAHQEPDQVSKEQLERMPADLKGRCFLEMYAFIAAGYRQVGPKPAHLITPGGLGGRDLLAEARAEAKRDPRVSRVDDH